MRGAEAAEEKNNNRALERLGIKAADLTAPLRITPGREGTSHQMLKV